MRLKHPTRAGVLVSLLAISACMVLSSAEAETASYDLAQRLFSLQDQLGKNGFSIKVPMSCKRLGDEGTILCRTVLADAHRGGHSAVVDVKLFERDVTFADQDDVVKHQIADIKGGSTVNSHPDINKKEKDGRQGKMEAGCHQIIGPVNSPAYCGLLFSPRVFIMAAIPPARPSTEIINLSLNHAADSAQDVTHAEDLAFVGLMLVARAQ